MSACSITRSVSLTPGASRPEPLMQEHDRRRAVVFVHLDAFGFTAQQRGAIERGNAARLFPRLG